MAYAWPECADNLKDNAGVAAFDLTLLYLIG